jgi:hypothetical protein
MIIEPNEIDTVEEIGSLHGRPIHLLRTKGGFWMGVGKIRGSYKEEVLAAGSHPAIVKYDLEKKYPDLQLIMQKSEPFIGEPSVDKHTHFLSEDLIKSGHDIYSIKQDDTIEWQLTKHNIKLGSVTGLITNESILIQNIDIPKEFKKSMAKATAEAAISYGVKKLMIGG